MGGNGTVMLIHDFLNAIRLADTLCIISVSESRNTVRNIAKKHS